MTPAALEFARPPAAMLIEPQIRAALEEDLGRAGDITSDLTIPADQKAEATEFVNYRPFAFQVSNAQKVADAVTMAALGLVALAIGAWLAVNLKSAWTGRSRSRAARC